MVLVECASAIGGAAIAFAVMRVHSEVFPEVCPHSHFPWSTTLENASASSFAAPSGFALAERDDEPAVRTIRDCPYRGDHDAVFESRVSVQGLGGVAIEGLEPVELHRADFVSSRQVHFFDPEADGVAAHERCPSPHRAEL